MLIQLRSRAKALLVYLQYDLGYTLAPKTIAHALPNFVTEINGLDLPFIHVRSQQRESAAAYRHWSGSIIEQLKL
jgi:hypothetical protein